MKHVICFSSIVFVLLLGSCSQQNSSVTATESWNLLLDNNSSNTATENYTKSSSGSITSAGAWQYGGVACTFQNGQLTVADTTINFTATGTANNPAAPSGYQSSSFNLRVHGYAHNGITRQGWVIKFTGTMGWPDSLAGSATGTRASGSGITN